MKYFIDTEFIEGKQDKTFLGIKYGETKPTIDLISIGIKQEDLTNEVNKSMFTSNGSLLNYGKDIYNYGGKAYYSISKDFNLKAAWNNEWVRENVLKSIFNELESKDYKECNRAPQFGIAKRTIGCRFTFNNLKKYINRYGKTNKQIAQEIIEFIRSSELQEPKVNTDYKENSPEFYGYYSDYDWVVFCWLFGSMVDLPKGFPMYCKDLKQELDNKYKAIKSQQADLGITSEATLDRRLEPIQSNPNYPKQINEHNALADAKWNYEFYKFLKTA